MERIDQERNKVIYLLNPDISFNDLTQVLLQEFNVVPESESNFTRVNQLHHILVHQFNQGRNVVLIVDDAQSMPVATLEGLRILSNLETATDKLLQIVFCGQPEFDDKLAQPELRQLQQRIAVRTILTPLTESQGVQYIQHRLSQAGATDLTIFTNAAIRQILKEAYGIPRLINILCDNALITTYGYQQKRVNRKVVREVIADRKTPARPPVRRWGLPAGVIVMAIIIVTAGIFLSRTTDLNSLMEETQSSPANAMKLPTPELLSPVSDRILATSETPVPRLEPTDNSNIAPSPSVLIEAKHEPAADSLDTQKSLPTLASMHRKALLLYKKLCDEEKLCYKEAMAPVYSNLDDVHKVREQRDQTTVMYREAIVLKPTERAISQTDSIDEPVTDNAGARESYTWVVRTGDRLIDLIEAMYGVRDERLLEWVRRYNPQLKNVDHIHVGERLTFPPIDQKE